jgi:hypothetical protein
VLTNGKEAIGGVGLEKPAPNLSSLRRAIASL